MEMFGKLLFIVRSGIFHLGKNSLRRIIGLSPCAFRGFLFYYAYGLNKYSENPFCVLIDRKVEFDISRDARIVVAKGASLEIGILEHPVVIPGRCNDKIRIVGTGALIVNGRFLIGRGCSIDIGNNAEMKIADGCFNGDCRINCGERIEIGKGFTASWGVDIMDNDGHPIFFDRDEPNPTVRTAPVIIGDNCWLGHDVIVLKGVVIDDGAIVGSGSVVTRNVPHHTIVAGNPIREIRNNVFWKI